MNKTTRKWTAGAVLALALCGVTVNVGRGDDDDDKLKEAVAAAKVVIIKNLSGVDGPAAMKLAKDHKMEATMKLFKPKSKGGIGVGSLTSAGHKDSIELLIRDYALKSPTKAEVTKNADDLLKAAQATAVIAELTPHWGPAKDLPGGKTQAKWKALTKDMKEGSADLVAAAKAKDDKAVATAAQKLNSSCAECHKIFRDDK